MNGLDSLSSNIDSFDPKDSLQTLKKKLGTLKQIGSNGHRNICKSIISS